MSLPLIRQALEQRLVAMVPALELAAQNVDASPDLDLPYQASTLLVADPDNTVFGPAYQERGILQVTLCYPLGEGTINVEARAQAVRDWFPRGLSLANGAIVTTIERTPTIGPGLPTDTEYQLPVRIRWYSNVTS